VPSTAVTGAAIGPYRESQLKWFFYRLVISAPPADSMIDRSADGTGRSPPHPA
jgi:hypothetical protein